MALHYVQDLSASKGFLGLSHDRREAAIAELDPPMGAIDDGLRNYSPSPHFVSRAISLTRPLKDPPAALYQAAYRSASISAAVMDLRQAKEFKLRYHAAARAHILRQVPMAVGAVSLGVSLSLLWASFMPALASLPVLVLASYLDRPYRRLSKVASWNGVRRH